MTNETKQHIDAARQVLVGVVPNPTSQIDQITNALIYKFMDDMDQSAIKQGGDPSFFIKDLKNYAWTRLMDARIGNQERMNIYSEALVKFSESKQLPQLFREIFKSAFLPYRSPEVLGLFLKEINYFDYSHPEELGNAYEYLLSVMGSQGDAGQFRTPRHIIDFMVDAVDPTMEDKVLDPACGTGGFLVSAYKHILEQHDGKNDSKNKKKPLTPDQRKNLMGNFEGYDIDPGMVRIAQVNMYLHQFKNPKIYPYDTLTMEERWNDKFSVILANPPFMSPKGGVSTHSKFSIQSSRSEVLFVDYIMNHLRPNGRAGIIVPEGIIFQSGGAHKELRKNLVEDGLCAVVSLPSGVFQPYSGVKTSILIFNNELSKQNKEILFIKIGNDGFDLGATKRPINKNDLPEALSILNEWKKGKKVENIKAVYVLKTKIAEDGDYNLSGDRYHLVTDYSNAKWPIIELNSVCEFIGGYAFKSESLKKEKLNKNYLPVVKIGNVDKGGALDISDAQYYEYKDSLKNFLISKDDILVAMTGATVGKVACSQFDDLLLNQRVGLIKADESKILKSFIKNLLLSEKFYKYCQLQAGGGAQGNISPSQIQKYKIPLPPLEIQEQIVKELDGYRRIILGAKEVVENWKPGFIIDPKWKKVKLEEISDRVTKGTTPTTNGFNFQDDGINFIKIESIDNAGYFIEEKFAHIDKKCNESLKRSQLKSGDVLFSIAGALGRVALVHDDILPANTNQALAIISPKEELNSMYLEQVLRSNLIQDQISGLKVGVAQSNISLAQVSNFEIPLPSLEIQEQIVKEIKSERTLIEGNKKLIEIYEQKTKEALAKLWEE